MKKPLILVLLVSVALNVYLFNNSIKSSTRRGGLLATIGDKQLHISDLKGSAPKTVAKLRRSADAILRREAEDWAADIVLPKEAAARSVSLNDLLSEEVGSKVKVSSDDAYKRYVLAPGADAFDWPEGLKKVHTAVYNEEMAAQRRRFLESLFPKYGVKILVPKGEDRPPAEFPPYRAPRAGKELSDAGRVIGPPSKGPADAPVVLEVYSDFLCPYSHRFAPTVDQLLQKYPDKVRVLFRHFPLPMHAGAPLMHEASVCAQEQGKFWEFHDALMKREPAPMDVAALSQQASELGLDAASFNTCMESGRYRSHIEREIAQGKKAGASGTPSYIFNGRVGSGNSPIEVLSADVDWFLKPGGPYPGRKEAPPKPGAAPQAQRPAMDPDKVYTFPAPWLEAGPSRGPKDAPITVIEFYDYNCPYCQKGANTIDEVLSKRNDVRLVSKQLPLAMHPNAKKASQAVLCADEQGKFWEYRAELFGASWGKQSVDDLKGVAAKTGLDAKKFGACLDGDKTLARVEEDMKVANANGASGTPAYFINGRPIFGAMPSQIFESALDEVKAKK